MDESPGVRRRAVWLRKKWQAGYVVLAFGLVYAIRQDADFAAVMQFLEWWLGIMVAMDVADKKFNGAS